jgi:toxin ParE1/3/4
MSYSVSILSEAELDIDNAYIWYELAQIDLGNKFYKKVDESIVFISNNPYSCQVIYKGIRRFVLKKFPYGVYYKVNFDQQEIQIVGEIHFKRSPKIIRQRI